MEHIRLPNEIKVNGSCYTKLEGLLCTWWRGATAAQGNKAEPLFGLDRRRLSELRIHVHQLLIADHYKILHTLAPWPDEWLEFIVDCCSIVAGEYASESNTFFLPMATSTRGAGQPNTVPLGESCRTETSNGLSLVGTRGRMV